MLSYNKVYSHKLQQSLIEPSPVGGAGVDTMAHRTGKFSPLERTLLEGGFA